MPYLVEIKKTENLKNIKMVRDTDKIKIQRQSDEKTKENNAVLQMPTI